MNPVVQYDSAIADKPTPASTTCQKCRHSSNATASLVLCRNFKVLSVNTYDSVTDTYHYPNARIVRGDNMVCDGFERKLNWFECLIQSFN